MLYINLKPFEVNHFPDGTQMLLDFKVYTPYVGNSRVPTEIYWKYESDEEYATLMYIVKHIKEHDPSAEITLTVPYLPNARMDRTKSPKEVFTLKYFCQFINWLGFTCVRVLDPHSDVCVALLDRVVVMDVNRCIEDAIDLAFEDVDEKSDMLLYFPDAGAMKRYSGLKAVKGYEMVYGQKVRNWETGAIEGLEVMDKNGHKLDDGTPLEGKTVLMIDDIISYGGTMYFSAKELKKLGAKDVFAYATHTETSVLDPEKGTFRKCLDDGTVKSLYTTSHLYKGRNYDKIKTV